MDYPSLGITKSVLSMVRYVRQHSGGERLEVFMRRSGEGFLALGRFLAKCKKLVFNRQHDAADALDIGRAVPGEFYDDGRQQHLHDDATSGQRLAVQLSHLPSSLFVKGVDGLARFEPTFRLQSPQNNTSGDAGQSCGGNGAEKGFWATVDLRPFGGCKP